MADRFSRSAKGDFADAVEGNLRHGRDGVRRCRRAVDHRRPASACCDLDRGVDARAGSTLRQATARGSTAFIRLAGQRPGRARQPGIHSERASACRDSRDKPRCSIRPKRELFDSIDVLSHAGLRDRALIGLMVYSFAHIGAALGMTVKDVYTRNSRQARAGQGHPRLSFDGVVRSA